jgi:hypothetical protein
MNKVDIAKDALKLLNSNKINANHGYYVAVELRFNPNMREYKFSEIFDQTNCRVCALGSLFISLVTNSEGPEFRIKNESNVVSKWCSFSRSEIIRYLREYFSAEELSLIEQMYEGWINELNSREDYTPKKTEVAEYLMTLDVKERLICILNNIIENNGEFKPETIKVKDEPDNKRDDSSRSADTSSTEGDTPDSTTVS